MPPLSALSVPVPSSSGRSAVVLVPSTEPYCRWYAITPLLVQPVPPMRKVPVPATVGCRQRSCPGSRTKWCRLRRIEADITVLTVHLNVVMVKLEPFPTPRTLEPPPPKTAIVDFSFSR